MLSSRTIADFSCSCLLLIVRDCYECMVRRATAREKFGREDKSAQMYTALGWRVVLLARMSCARVCPFKTRRSLRTIRNSRLRTRRCDCSFVLATPLQTSVGGFKPSWWCGKVGARSASKPKAPFPHR
jgi:hypothetical protein